MYKELQDLKSRATKREAHSLDLPNLDPDLHAENYLVSTIHMAIAETEDIALLNSTTTHTILHSLGYFDFRDVDPAWQSCTLTTIANIKNFKFRDDRVKLMLPGGFPLNIRSAIFASAAPHNLISYKDLRAKGSTSPQFR